MIELTLMEGSDTTQIKGYVTRAKFEVFTTMKLSFIIILEFNDGINGQKAFESARDSRRIKQI